MTTLADQQLIKDKLRLMVVEQECDELTEATTDTRAAIAAGRAARGLVRAALARLEQRWLAAIAGERDETRCHYLLTDTLHATLGELGETLDAGTPTLKLVGQRMARGLKPRPILTVSQWADRYRVLKSGTNAPGPWRTELTPYLKAIQDDLSEHSPVRTVVFMKSAGVGGTEAMYNWIGYLMHHLGNKDVLVVVPTLELRDRSFNPRLMKMLDETPALAPLVTTASRNRANRTDLMEYGARARLIKAGANSPDSLRSDHLPYVLLDEVDAMPWDVGGEGDPLTLIENRQRTFTRAKTYMVSTPTIEGQSRIEQMYLRSDQRRYEVPCPHCQAYQPLEWPLLKWRKAPPPEGDPHPLPQVQEAWYVCRECGAEIGEGHKPGMLAAGRWVARRPAIKHTRGYHLNALYAPIGLGLSWQQVAQKWENCQGDSAELKGFINTYLGQTWKEQGESLDEVSLISRLEEYGVAGLPVALISAGVDVQKDRLECTLVGWGAGEEAWVLDHCVLPGDTTGPDVWEELNATLLAGGVQIAAIDSGYNTTLVYDFVRRRPWCVAIKGFPGLFRPLVEDERRRRQRRRRKTRSGLQVEPVGVDQGKALLYARLKLPLVQATGDSLTPAPRPGFIHFPQGGACDDEYFAQLAAERLVTKFRGSRPHQEWVQTRPRNEALDCLVYALTAMRLSNVDLDMVISRRQAEPGWYPRLPWLRAPLLPPVVFARDDEAEADVRAFGYPDRRDDQDRDGLASAPGSPSGVMMPDEGWLPRLPSSPQVPGPRVPGRRRRASTWL